MSENNYYIPKLNDELIALRLGISVEQYRKEQDEARQRMATLVQQVESEKLRIIQEAYREELEYDPDGVAALYRFYTFYGGDVRVTPLMHIDNDGKERTVYNWSWSFSSRINNNL